MPEQRALSGRRDKLCRAGQGQTLVEFALVVPLFFTLLLGLMEVAFLLNAELTLNFATREATLVAAEAGNSSGADCSILQAIERSVNSPADKAGIAEVRIFDADRNGVPVDPPAVNVYQRSGSMTCTMPGGATKTVPYSMVGAGTYASPNRCNVFAGCESSGQTDVDTIGVRVTYLHQWRTPFFQLLGGSNSGYTVVKSNAMRMEPVL